MSFNTFGHMFRVTTFGESHGPAIGGVVDGCPPGIPLTEADIQPYLDKRRPGQSRFTTQRQEPDDVRILSGVFKDERMGAQVTTGTPIGLLIDNVDQRSKDYSDIRDKYRPGHADYTYEAKYGLRDYRGGGRQSARETAMRVAAGAIARKIVPGMMVRAALIQMGPETIDRARWDWNEVDKQSVLLSGRTDGEVLRKLPRQHPQERLVGRRRDRGGGRRRAGRARRAGLRQARRRSRRGHDEHQRGEGRRDRRRHGRAALTGEENGDEMRMGNDGRPVFLSNNAGGILGGISTGQQVVVRFAVKPTSSILTPRRTLDRYGDETEISTKGRHDPCVGIRAVPIGEAMMAIVLADHYLRQRGQVGESPAWPFAKQGK